MHNNLHDHTNTQDTDMSVDQADLLTDIYLALSYLMSEFHIDVGTLCYGLTNFHIKHIAHTHAHKSMLRIALGIGIDRRTVAIVLKNRMPPHKKPSLPRIVKRLQQLSEYNNAHINKQGLNSIESVMNETAPGATTLKTIIDELLDMGAIEDHGTSVKLLNNPFTLSSQQRQKFKSLSSQWLKAIDKQQHNSGGEHNTQTLINRS